MTRAGVRLRGGLFTAPKAKRLREVDPPPTLAQTRETPRAQRPPARAQRPHARRDHRAQRTPARKDTASLSMRARGIAPRSPHLLSEGLVSPHYQYNLKHNLEFTTIKIKINKIGIYAVRQSV